MLLNSVRFTVKCLKCTNPTRIVQMKVIPEVKKYSEYSQRHPVRITNEEEILQYVEAAKGPNQYLEDKTERKPLTIRPKPKGLKKKIPVTENDATFKDDGKLNYKELKETDSTLTKLMMQVRSRKTRDRNSRIILEGHRLIVDAIEAGASPEVIVFSRIEDVLKLPLPSQGVKIFKVPYKAIQIWSKLTTPPGIMGFFKIPETESVEPSPDALPLTIICDNVREPGNMGSIMRAAAGVGCKKLILVKGCVDIWDSKVLRSATGAHFRFPILPSKSWNDVRKLIDSDCAIFVADNSTIESTTESLEEDKTLTEPLELSETVEPIEQESNNDKKRTKNYSINEDELFQLVDENIDEKKSYREKMRNIKIAKNLTKNIPIIPYYSTDYTTGENVIIIGGETEGLSLEALSFVRDTNGIRINIPMTNGVDSLNTGMALGIVAFELRRQFSLAAAQNKKC